MTADSKDRHSWRKIPSDAVEEARRRAGLNKPEPKPNTGTNAEPAPPGTRTSWLPSVRLPGVRRAAIKVIDEPAQKPPSTALPPAAKKHKFLGGATLRWQPNQPSQPAQPSAPSAPPDTRLPVLRPNVIVDVGEKAPSAAPRADAARSQDQERPAVQPARDAVASNPAQSGERPLAAPESQPVGSVKAALAAIDAAVSHRSARLHSVPTPIDGMASGEVHAQAALGVIDAALSHESGAKAVPSAPAPMSLTALPLPVSAEAQSKPSRSARTAERSAQQQHAMRTPSLTAAPRGDVASTVASVAEGPSATSAALALPSTPPMAATEPAPRPSPRRQPEEPKPVLREQPYRANALRAKSEEPLAAPLPEVTASGWSVLLVLSTLLMLGLGLAYVGHVEQTSIASGVLQVRGGPRPVLAQASGPVLSLEVVPGDSVTQGQTIARIDATDLNAREQRDVAQLAQAKIEKERIGAAELGRLQADQRALRQKRALLEERARLKGDAVRDRRERMEQVQHAARAGVATQGDALSVREAERAASEELLLIRQQITETDLQLTEAHKNYQSTLERLRHDLDSAATSLAETRTLLRTTEIRAPVAGRVESLQVTQGQVISAGSVLARIVPEGAVSSAVVFAPAKDASFLREGLEASLEFASLPSSEFGKSAARVTRVSKDVASMDELVSALGRGSDEPVIRVELELLPSAQLTRIKDKLRSGERLTARLNTRDRRMITLLFDFLRKWYDP